MQSPGRGSRWDRHPVKHSVVGCSIGGPHHASLAWSPATWTLGMAFLANDTLASMMQAETCEELAQWGSSSWDLPFGNRSHLVRQSV